MAALMNGNHQRQANQPTHLSKLFVIVFLNRLTHTHCLFDLTAAVVFKLNNNIPQQRMNKYHVHGSR